jgi:hypothetical protein
MHEEREDELTTHHETDEGTRVARREPKAGARGISGEILLMASTARADRSWGRGEAARGQKVVVICCMARGSYY